MWSDTGIEVEKAEAHIESPDTARKRESEESKEEQAESSGRDSKKRDHEFIEVSVPTLWLLRCRLLGVRL